VSFIAIEADAWLLFCRPVNPLIGCFHPMLEMCLEMRPRFEASASERIALRVSDATFGLAFRACTIWLTRARSDIPVATERVECWMQPDGLFLRITLDDETACVVDEQRLRHTTEVPKRADDPLPPIVVALASECAHVLASRVRQHRDEQHHAYQLLADPNQLLAEVDLHLVTRRSFKTHRRELRRSPRYSVLLECTLDCPQLDVATSLGEELLHHDGISLSSRVEQANRFGALLFSQSPRGRSLLDLRSGSATEISADRRATHNKLTRDPSDAPTHFE
jgi:hypothetical protein